MPATFSTSSDSLSSVSFSIGVRFSSATSRLSPHFFAVVEEIFFGELVGDVEDVLRRRATAAVAGTAGPFGPNRCRPRERRRPRRGRFPPPIPPPYAFRWFGPCSRVLVLAACAGIASVRVVRAVGNGRSGGLCGGFPLGWRGRRSGDRFARSRPVVGRNSPSGSRFSFGGLGSRSCSERRPLGLTEIFFGPPSVALRWSIGSKSLGFFRGPLGGAVGAWGRCVADRSVGGTHGTRCGLAGTRASLFRRSRACQEPFARALLDALQ